jgi:hypothetical protein
MPKGHSIGIFNKVIHHLFFNHIYDFQQSDLRQSECFPLGQKWIEANDNETELLRKQKWELRSRFTSPSPTSIHSLNSTDHFSPFTIYEERFYVVGRTIIFMPLPIAAEKWNKGISGEGRFSQFYCLSQDLNFLNCNKTTVSLSSFPVSLSLSFLSLCLLSVFLCISVSLYVSLSLCPSVPLSLCLFVCLIFLSHSCLSIFLHLYLCCMWVCVYISFWALVCVCTEAFIFLTYILFSLFYYALRGKHKMSF